MDVKINYPLDSVIELEDEIKRKYNLENVFVIPVYIHNSHLIQNDVGKAAANYLYEICDNKSILGVSWGTTLNGVVPYLKPKVLPNMKIVQLNGGAAKSTFSTGSVALLEKFSKTFSSDQYLLPVPSIVDSSLIADAIMTDSSIEYALDLGRRSNIAVYGIGNVSHNSVLYKGGYFKEGAYDELIAKKAVGDICSRYFSVDGQIVDEELNRRTIGLKLEELRKKDFSIAIASGIEKAESVKGALKGGYANTIFIDEELAKKII
ncbi:RNA polymerase subunit sigma-70 [Planococcus ruber]|nr:RNA polymerase subunit sigma-70 [Planococcus ruber]